MRVFLKNHANLLIMLIVVQAMALIFSCSREGDGSSGNEEVRKDAVEDGDNSSPGASVEMCGDKEYSPATRFCQSPNVVKNLCNGQTFTATEFCQNATVKDLCGTATYMVTQFCQSPNVVKNLCGGQTFTASEFCQGTTVKDLCGTATYTATQVCQGPNTIRDLCGDQILTETEFCQEGTNEVKDLCGTATYMATQFCQSPNVVRNLCGGQTFSATEYCKNNLTPSEYGSVQDANGTPYKTVEIGSQTWMAANLNYATEGSKCYGDNTGGDSEGNCDTYGRLYNWATAMGGVCPAGWHLPSWAEWDVLLEYVQTDNGKTYTTGTDASIAGKYLKALSGWPNSYPEGGMNIDSNGEDKYGFAAIPGGYHIPDDYPHYSGSILFFLVGNVGGWWSSSEHVNNLANACNRRMRYLQEDVTWDCNPKVFMYSVRCVKNDDVQD